MDERRTGKPMPLADLTGAVAAACRRVTGKTVEEWIEVFSRRRQEAYRRGVFRGGIMLQDNVEDPERGTHEVAKFCTRFGLDEPDDLLYIRSVPVEVVIRNRQRHHMPAPRIPAYNDRPAGTIAVYMLNPDKYPR